MDRYVNIPAKRMAYLTAKYVHHAQMRSIEDAVRRSSGLDENVFQVLDRMEALQNEVRIVTSLLRFEHCLVHYN